MNKFLLFILLLFFAPLLTAQQMQWASEVVDKSSEYGRNTYSARQALGIPNAGNGTGMAWAPAREESTLGEHLHLRYTVAMRVRQIVVAESKNPGSIKRITFFDDNRKRHVIYQNENPQPTGTASEYFIHTFPLTDYKVKEVLIELRTSAVPGSNHIDAVGISANEQSYIGPKIAETLYARGVSDAESLGMQINSAYAERLPIISPDGKTLWFARKWHPQNRGDDEADDIWVSNLQGGDTWSRPINVGPPLNNEQHNFVFSVSPAGDKIWLANEYGSAKKDGISYSKRSGRIWSRPRNVRINDHYNRSPFVCYSMSTDESVLLLTAEREEGLGESDIYVSFRQSNGDYSKPVNLGTTINTVGDESSVFLAADGKTIYFSGNGHAGYGGYDMFRSQRLDESWTQWSQPLNLGERINSSENDYNYTIPAKGDYAYFSRDVNGSGMSDLFRIKLPEEVQPEPVVLVKGRLINAATGQPVGGALSLEKEGSAERNQKIVSDDRGNFAMVLPYGENVVLYGEREGYFAVSERVELAKNPEGLDADGGSPTEENALTHNPEIDRMQLRLQEIDRDLRQLESVPPPTFRLEEKVENQVSRPYASDPELLALQRRYEARYRYLSENGGDTEKGNSEKTYTPVISGDEEEDAELAAMKEKFNRLNQKSQPTPVKKAKKPQGIHYFPWEMVEQKTRRETAAELLPEVRRELQDELLEETKDELAGELSPADRDILQKINPHPTAPEQLTVRGGSATETALPDWANEIKSELRIALADEVRAELRRELRAEVKEELRRELEIQLKKELESELRRELEEKIRAELLAEQSLGTPKAKPAPVLADEEEEADTSPKKIYREPVKQILLAPVEVGQIIPLNNIFFASNESDLKPESNTELERVREFMQNNPGLSIEIGGHTNGWCSHIFANELSTERAKEVKRFLTDSGIDGNRIKVRGYGKTAPIASNDTKAGRRKNQRVEMRILGRG